MIASPTFPPGRWNNPHIIQHMSDSHHTALVLSGGGVRGAYEVGVVAGIIDVLGLTATDTPPFRIFTGTSVGAINATFLAAHTTRGDLAVAELVNIWESLELRHHLQIDPLGLFGRPLRRLYDPNPGFGRSMLNPKPLERLVKQSVPWKQLHAAVDGGDTRALIVTALEVASGRTTMFAELSPDQVFRPSKDPRRRGEPARITGDHVLASAALPLAFPARRIGSSFYCDGDLRFNTPIAPAIRAGAKRLVVVSPMFEDDGAMPVTDHTHDYPSLWFLLGKLLNALLLDPVSYDLQVLKRFNRLIEVLEESLTPEELARVHQVMVEHRGLPYQRIDCLAFRPSRDIGAIASDYVHDTGKRWRISRVQKMVMRLAARGDSDLASYVLFDGEFARRLIELGRADATQRADDIRAMFSPD